MKPGKIPSLFASDSDICDLPDLVEPPMQMTDTILSLKFQSYAL
jgi:hypothetical protein